MKGFEAIKNLSFQIMQKVKTLPLIGLTVFFLSPFMAYAENLPPLTADQGRILVKVRAIEATGRNEGGVEAAEIEGQDPRLHDVSKNLSHLEFSKFKLLSEQEAKISVMDKEVIALGAGHSLALRPLYVSNGRVGMWIHWTDKDTVLLDTRMHFACSDKVITGAESDMTGDRAVILAVAAHPIKAP